MKEGISLMPKSDHAGLFIVVSIVMFVLAMEYIIARRKGKKIFRFENTIANISMGIFDRIAGVFLVPIIFFFYHYLHEYFAIFKIPETLPWFLIAVLFSDIVWYFYHLSGHRINLFWGSHIVHHQSEDYNYTVAFNLTPFQVFIRILFWSVMPIIGFSAEVVLGTHAVLGLYQFLLHTPLIPKLGIIEEFMVTPSHHRVHHGSNPEYLDKNFGGILIVWDRLFGTFKREEAEVKYGITMDINSRDFVTGVFHYYSNLLHLMSQMPTLKGKLNILFRGPDWIPSTGELNHLPLYVEKGSYEYKIYSLSEKIYIIGHIILVALVLCTMSYKIAELPTFGLEVMSFYMLVSLVTIGRMMEKQSVIQIELFKYLIVAGYLLYYFL